MNIRRLITITAVTAVTAFFCAVGATAEDLTYGDFSYIYRDNGTIEITEYSGSATEVSIPEKINGTEVTSIGEAVFFNRTDITSVTIPKTIDIIRNSAFYGCNGLTAVDIPDGVQTIESNAFFNCYNLGTVSMTESVTLLGTDVFKGTALVRINNNNLIYHLNNPIVYVGKWVIQCYQYAYEAEIPEDAYGIVPKAFYGCVNLEEIKIPSTVKYIGENAFYGSELLTKIEMPSSVEYIGNAAFDLTPYIAAQSTPVKYAGNWAVSCDSDITNAEIASGTIGICDRLFNEKTTLQTASLPDGMLYIGEKAFYNCTALESVAIPESVKHFGEYCFGYCAKLTTVNLPDTLTEIPAGIFAYCSSFVSVDIPSGVTKIGEYAFSGCALTSVRLPESLIELCGRAFYSNKKLASITIPDNVRIIGQRAFGNCTLLESVTLGSSVERIEDEAFFKCTALKEITIPQQTQYIGEIAIGYGTLNYSTYTYDPYDDFLIYCYEDSAGYQYAVDCGIGYELIIPVSLDVKGFAEDGRTPSSITLGWEENVFAKGYEIEQYINSQWVNIADITDGSTTSYCVGNLAGGTEYMFRIRAYDFGDSTVRDYGDYAQVIETRTKLATVTGFSLGGRASNALRLNWEKSDKADGYIIEQYIDGKWTRISKITTNKTTTLRVEGLQAGTAYRFRMRAYAVLDASTADYSACTAVMALRTNPSAVSGFRLSGRTATELSFGWKENASADGYIIEKYNGTSWERVTKITDNTITAYRAVNLTPSTTYKFRIRAYKMSGSTALYSSYSSAVSGTTAPSAVTGFKFGNRAATALRVNWSKNISADGYIIEQYKNGEWVRIKKITDNTVTTYRVAGLSPSTAYKFRIKSYKMSDSVALYSECSSEVTATTSPSAVTGFKADSEASSVSLSWTQNASAQGYIIEIYKNGVWTRAAKMTSATKTACKVSSLESGTTYSFRIKAYYMDGGTALYSSYTTISGTTA